MKRLAAIALSIYAALAAASIPPPFGFGSQTASSGSAPTINTASLSSVSVGSTTAQTLSITCNNTPCTCSQVGAAPNNGLWVYITPACVVSGTPQWAEGESVIEQVTDSIGQTAQRTLTLSTAASGSLAIVSGATLPACTNGGACSYEEIASGGVPPYRWMSPQSETPCFLSWDGWLTCAPTSTATLAPIVTVVDSAGHSATLTQSMSVNSTLTFGLQDSTDGVIHLPPAHASVKYSAQVPTYGGTGTGKTCTLTGSPPAWASIATGTDVCVISGTPTASGAVLLSLHVTDSASNAASASGLVNIGSSGQVSRPAYNSASSNGFFVVNGLLYDYNGYPFTIRGIDHLHGDNTADIANIAKTNASAVRTWDVNCTSSLGISLLSGYVSAKILPILTLAGIPTGSQSCGGGTSGNTSTAALAAAVQWWISNEASFATYMQKMAINVANEWGPGSTSAVWENSYLAVTGTVSSVSGTTITLSAGGASNPFANSPFAYIAGSCGVSPQVVNLSSPGGASGAWTVVSSVNLGTLGSGCTLYGGAIGALRAAGYTCPIMIDAGGSGQDWTGITAYGGAIQASDPLQNVIFSDHPYGSFTNAQAQVASITTGTSNTSFTLNNSLAFHPFNPTWPLLQSNNFLFYGSSNLVVTGAAGMTSANGVWPDDSHSYGSSGTWSMLATVNSSGWSGSYTANSATVMFDNNYQYVISKFSALKAQNVAVCLCEFGPGDQTGSPVEYYTGGTGGVSSTTLAVSAIGANSAPVLPQMGGPSQIGRLSGQSSGTTGGIGNYTFYSAQTVTNGTLYLSGTGNIWDVAGVGPSPSTVSPEQIISAAEAYQLAGWNYWAWDDNNGANNDSYFGGFFGMTGCCFPTGSNGSYSVNTPSGFTAAGLDVGLNPRYGLYALPAPAGVM